MIFEKIDNLIRYYLGKNISKDEIIEFQNQFEVIFSSFRDELKNEIGIYKYEILDSIYMAFDSYEPNEEIRKDAKFCIDEKSLITKIENAYESIKST